MTTTRILGTVLFVAATLAGCREPAAEPEPLPPPETFTWTGDQPVMFSPPPAGWERSRYQNGGTEGVGFVRAGSGGEFIFAAEWFFVGKRDRCARLQELRRDLDNLDRAAFLGALTRARLYANEPLNVGEERQAEVVNATLDRARQAYLAADPGIVRTELGRAIDQAGRIRLTLADTVERALFTAEKNRVFPALHVDEPRASQLGGEDALTVHFTFEGSAGPMVGRRVYVAKNNRLFEVGFQGLQKNLALFEEILESFEFPPGGCRH